MLDEGISDMAAWVRKLEQIWKHDATAIVLCLTGALCAIWFHWSLPLPGVSVAVLGGMAAIMSLRPDMKIIEKAAWMIIIFAVLYAEIRAIRKDRADSDAKALADRQTQDAAFKAIQTTQNGDFTKTAGGLQKAIDGINVTMKTTNRTLAQTHPHGRCGRTRRSQSARRRW